MRADAMQIRVGWCLILALVVCFGSASWWSLDATRRQTQEELLQVLASQWEAINATSGDALIARSDTLATRLSSRFCASDASWAASADASLDAGKGAAHAVPSPTDEEGVSRFMDAWTRAHPAERVQLTRADAALIYSSATDIDAWPLASSAMVRRVIDHAPVTRFVLVGPHRYGWLHARRVSCGAVRGAVESSRVLVMAQDAAPTIHELAQRLGGTVTIANLRGDDALQADKHENKPANKHDGQNLFPTLFEDARALSEPVMQRIETRGAVMRQASLPIFDDERRPVALLVWRVDVSAQAAVQRQRDLALWLGCAAIVALLLVAVPWLVQWSFEPLHRVSAAVSRLAAGRYRMPMDDDELQRDDDTGAIARSTALLRGELLNLDMLREERERGGRQQGRLIDTHLRRLADSLDDAERAEFGTLMQHRGVGHDAMSHLAAVLGRLSELLLARHRHLVSAMQALSESVAQEARFAALRQELDIARRMQSAILPRAAPTLPGVALHATMIPAAGVGGDFYDYFTLDDDRLGIVVADVSGKGIPAAFFMSIARTLLKSIATIDKAPGVVVDRLNALLAADNPRMMFVTLFYGVLNVRNGDLHYVNAGHTPAVHMQAETMPTYLRPAPNVALGIVDQYAYHVDHVRLTPGDALVLYTDGVTEAQDPSRQLFGNQGLLDMCAQMMTIAPSQMNETLVERVRAFEQGGPPSDDLTCLTLRFLGVEGEA